MIPLFLKIRLPRDKEKPLKVFIPLFFIWIVLFPLLLALAPFVLVAIAVLLPRGYGKILLIAYPALFSLICSLSGLRIQIEKVDRQISILIK